MKNKNQSVVNNGYWHRVAAPGGVKELSVLENQLSIFRYMHVHAKKGKFYNIQILNFFGGVSKKFSIINIYIISFS